MTHQFRPITLAVAFAEPLADQLFGPSYDERQRQLRREQQLGALDRTKYQPWKKPRIERSQ